MKIKSLYVIVFFLFNGSAVFADNHDKPVPDTSKSKSGCALELAGMCLTAAAGMLSYDHSVDGAVNRFRVVAVLHSSIKISGQKRWGFMLAPGDNEVIDAVGTGMAWGFGDKSASGGLLTAQAGVMAKFYRDDLTNKDDSAGGVYLVISQSF